MDLQNSFIIFNILNLLAFLTSLVLLVNVVFEIRYLILSETFAEHFELVISLLVILFVSFFTIESPYGGNPSGISFHLILACMMIFSSTIEPVQDPNIILTVATERTSTFFDDEASSLSVSGFASGYLQIVEYCKMYMLVWGCLSVIVELFYVEWYKRKFWTNVCNGLDGRISILLLIASNIVVSLLTFASEENLAFVAEDLGSIRIVSDGFAILDSIVLSYVIISFLLFTALFIVIGVADNSSLAIVPAFLSSVEMLKLLEQFNIDGNIYSFVLIAMIANSAVATAALAYFLTHGSSIDSVFKVSIPSVLFKVGASLSVISMLFLVPAYSSDWVQVNFYPITEIGSLDLNLDVDVDLDLANALRTAEANIEKVEESASAITEGIIDLAVKLNPCLQKTVPAISVDRGSGVDAIDNLQMPSGDGYNDIISDRKKAIAEDVNDPYNSCIDKSNTDNFINLSDQLCLDLKEELDREEQNLKSIAEEEKAGADTLYSVDDADDIDYKVDQQCVDTACNVVLGAGISALALGLVPFLPGIVPLTLKIGSKVTHTVFKVGRSVVRQIPKIKSKRNKIRKLYTLLKTLVRTSKNALKFTPAIAITFLPILLGGFVAISIIFYAKKEVSDRLATSMKIVLGLWLPILVADVAIIVILLIIPSFFNRLFKVLPAEYVVIESEFLAGYDSLMFAYVTALIGNGLLMLSSLISVFFESSSEFGEYVVARTRNVLRTLIRFFLSIPKALTRRRRRRRASQTKIEPSDAKVTTKAPVSSHLRNIVSNWNNTWLFPLIISSVSLYFAFGSLVGWDTFVLFGEKGVYLDLVYTANADISERIQDISDVLQVKESSVNIGEAVDSDSCGVVGLAVKELVENINLGDTQLDFGGLGEKVSEFSDQMEKALSGTGSIVESLQDMIDLKEIKLDVTFFSGGEFVENLFIFGIPLVNTIMIALTWLVLTLGDKASRIASLFFSSHEEDGADGVGTSRIGSSINQSIPFFILMSSVVNILMHQSTASFASMVTESKMPFIQVNVYLGDKFYQTILCSCLNIFSVVAVYVANVLE